MVRYPFFNNDTIYKEMIASSTGNPSFLVPRADISMTIMASEITKTIIFTMINETEVA